MSINPQRRAFLRQSAVSMTGLTSIALASSLQPTLLRGNERKIARSVIFLYMSGGPSQVDTFDPKPALATYSGQNVPESIARNVPPIKRSGLNNIMPSHWSFQPHGESGIPVSELLPHTAQHADDLCVIRSVKHLNPVHGPGECVCLTGVAGGDRPSIGAWTTYALGNINENLPTFMAMNIHSDGMQFPQRAGWSTGFLPAKHQGVVINPATGIKFTDLPEDTPQQRRIQQLQLLDFLNEKHRKDKLNADLLQARIKSYEMTAKMQVAAPELFDWETKESEATRILYGIGKENSHETGVACLMGRRMVERGVRFVQIRVGGWDAHGNIKSNHSRQAARTDKPIAGLLRDLKQRGLLTSTLVVWAGEFGRTPTMEGTANGRDHSPNGYSIWMAGGGVRGGQIIGQTDDLGYVATERPVSPFDYHATILAALGIDPAKLSYNHLGREETPLFNDGAVIEEVLA
mgnify:FL=1